MYKEIRFLKKKILKIDRSLIIHLNASDERGIDTIRNQIHSFVNSNNLFEKGDEKMNLLINTITVVEIQYQDHCDDKKNIEKYFKNRLKFQMETIFKNKISFSNEKIYRDYTVRLYYKTFMSDLENFAHNVESFFPDLLKIALIHYQFETIHPFLDGNGRVGRLMITLYLVEKGILKKPILYLSDFFERNRMLYYDNLTRVREKNDLSQWLKFFLVGVIETAKNGINTFDSILKLQKEVEIKLSF